MSLENLQDKYFVNSMNGVNGKSIVILAKELGFTNICNCLGTKRGGFL
ncbi:hypothetical protein [uncultured Apibacter sp.]|nr:hypothetical protein [uncultured Apibacter sp.]